MTAPNPSKQLPPARWLRWCLRALTALVGMVLVMSAGLFLAGRLLIHESSADLQANLLILDAQPDSERLADWMRDCPECSILLIEKFPARPMQLGVLPPYHEFMTDRLVGTGVPSERIEVIPGQAFDMPSHVQALAKWLDRPHDSGEMRPVVVVVERMSSANWRWLINRTLPSEQARLVTVCPVEVAGINEWNWWRSKVGVITVLKQWMFYATAKPTQHPAPVPKEAAP